MDLVTLALAKKYTDEQVGSGGGGTAEIPFFDLAAMGLPSIGFDEVVNTLYKDLDADFTEFENAVKNGPVKIRLLCELDGMSIELIATCMPICANIPDYNLANWMLDAIIYLSGNTRLLLHVGSYINTLSGGIVEKGITTHIALL